ncbi:amino acid adenylation domain-containing protein [Sphaerisporangium corydalis]|uniref:Amino acid adenylation domain-containing protein n=1 Tax=Sphaerisporangium corydalis TaxID=1441875 RepID=A0ABV9EQ47_9ACTN|nr:amino acid adenylation domain-containing protein [Sphaerisporangium corydalis]
MKRLLSADQATQGTIVDDIRGHAVRAPHAPAIVTQRAVISYRELTDRIERLARTLAAAGVGAESRCAVAVEDDVHAVIAMAAVMRAGGAFLTLDPGQPVQRLHAMAAGVDTRFQITTAALAGRLALPIGGPAILIDDLGGTAGATLPAHVPPRSLAYISHTSGSTGTPNPVMIEHGGLGAYLRFIVADGGLGPHTAALQLAPFGYDASIRGVFAPLAAGGRLILLPRSTLLRPAALAAAVEDHGVNAILSSTPTLLTALAQDEDVAARLGGVGLILCAGESLRPFLSAGGRRLTAGRLVNHYGPTECTITSTRHDVPPRPDTEADLIGTPIDGVTVRLLDPGMRAVPDGATGEIYIGGAGVARGYGGRPALTAQRFVPDPCGPPGARLYRTGDLARRGPGGVLEFLGRDDRQVKIRGYRVEPAEVEGALLGHPAVTGAVVTSAADERGRVHLVAHVMGALAGVTDAALRAHLALTLPPHLMPRRFHRLETMPTTHSGKTDRTALLAHAPAHAGPGA